MNTPVRVTAELRNATRHQSISGGYYLTGQVFGDIKGRFYDGDRIHTSLIASEDGDIVTTRNSVYRVSYAPAPADEVQA